MFFKKKKNKETEKTKTENSETTETTEASETTKKASKKLSKKERTKQNNNSNNTIPKTSKKSLITLRNNQKVITERPIEIKSISEMTLEDVYKEISSLEPKYVSSTTNDEDCFECITINVSDVLKSIACLMKRSQKHSIVFINAQISDESIEKLKLYEINVEKDDCENNSVKVSW